MSLESIVPPKDSDASFEDLVSGIVTDFLNNRKRIGLSAGDFFVPVINDSSNHLSYWGVIDLTTMPEEDVYTAIYQRLCAARAWVGTTNIRSYGIVDINSVLRRQIPHIRGTSQ